MDENETLAAELRVPCLHCHALKYGDASSECHACGHSDPSLTSLAYSLAARILMADTFAGDGFGGDGAGVPEYAEAIKRNAVQSRDFVAVGLYAWGRGNTDEEALANMVKAGGKRSHFILYDCPKGTFVSGSGSLVWSGAAVMLGARAPVELRRKMPAKK